MTKRFQLIGKFSLCVVQGVFLCVMGLTPPMAGADFALESWRPGEPARAARVPDGESGASGRTFQATILYSTSESSGWAESAVRDSGALEAHQNLDDPFALPGEIGRPDFSNTTAARPPLQSSRAGKRKISTITSCLLATPWSESDDKKDWTVKWQAFDAEGRSIGESAHLQAAGASCVWARPVRVGAIDGVQVFLDRSKFETLLQDDSSGVRITVMGPGATAATRQQPRIGRPLASLFLNGAEAAGMAAASEPAARQRKESGSLPPSPGEYRLSYPSL